MKDHPAIDFIPMDVEGEEVRFPETLDSELSALVERIAQLPISERTELILSLANLSRSSLLERLRDN